MINFLEINIETIKNTLLLLFLTNFAFTFKPPSFKRFFNAAVAFSSEALPGVQSILDEEKRKALHDIEKKMLGSGDVDAISSIPLKSKSPKSLTNLGSKLKATHSGFASGKQWGGVYHLAGSELTDLQAAFWKQFNSTNTLYPGAFPAIRKMEAELIAMTCDLVGGACGLLSSGGTESILLAVLAYREQGRKRHISITAPEIICGITAHPALAKACFYFNVKLIKLPVDVKTQQMSVASVKANINKNTLCIYASAPTFPHGVIDPVEQLGSLALSHKIGLHVDNCLGGFLTSYLKKLNLLKGREFDFNVPGVTTMSVDLHKYGGCCKGVSVCVFKSKELRQASYVPSFDGCEGLYITPTMQGSRSGATIAAAWASVLWRGEDGYLKMAKKIHDIEKVAMDGVAKIDELEPLLIPDCAILPLKAAKGSKISIYAVASYMEKRGWNLFTGTNPPTLGLCFGEIHEGKVMKELLQDLQKAVTHVKLNPKEKIEGNAAVYGAMSTIPDNLLDGILREYVDLSLTVKHKEKKIEINSSIL